jgi:hypothetical protein
MEPTCRRVVLTGGVVGVGVGVGLNGLGWRRALSGVLRVQ